jgi:hypothetical protein
LKPPLCEFQLSTLLKCEMARQQKITANGFQNQDSSRSQQMFL